MNLTQADRAGHTPGPWFTKREGFSTVYVETRIGGGLIQEVAACGPTQGGTDEQAANARLIAAAPELLDALKVAYIAMQHMGNVLNNIDAVDEKEDAQHDAAFEAVSLAIARATGAAA